MRDEQRDIEEWRYLELIRAGCDPEAANILAMDMSVDLHRACDMLKKGCSVADLLKIVL